MRAAGLERAQLSNRRIGMALGILMARGGLTEQQAFDALRTASSRRNVRLRDLAEQVIFTGTL
ncbi:ANTAR domain-containing protein [Geodermatophilus sp. SYSU D00815]